MNVAIALFTRDLRVHDNPVLHAACDAAAEVVPLFVLDTAILRGRSMSLNRAAFLADSLADLDSRLRERGGRLVLRSGDVAKEVERIVADLEVGEVHLAADVSGYSQRREQILRERLAAHHCRLRVHATTITVVEPGAITPSGEARSSPCSPLTTGGGSKPGAATCSARPAGSPCPTSRPNRCPVLMTCAQVSARRG